MKMRMLVLIFFCGLAVGPAHASITIRVPVGQGGADVIMLLGALAIIGFVIFLCLAALYEWWRYYPTAEQKAATTRVLAFTETAVASLRKQTWSKIRINKARRGNNYDVTIFYKYLPDSYQTVANDTATLTNSILGIVRNGVTPGKGTTTIKVSTVLGEENSIRGSYDFGTATYNSARNQIVFRRPDHELEILRRVVNERFLGPSVKTTGNMQGP